MAASPPAFTSSVSAPAFAPNARRVGLVVGAIVAAACVAAAATTLDPLAATRVDAERATLLRGMAAIKALLVAPALALVWWRFGFAVSPREGAVYLVGTWTLIGATTAIACLWSIIAAAIAFHAAMLAMGWVAWSDDGTTFARRAWQRRGRR